MTSLPDNTVVYVIGDIHGEHEYLQLLLQAIAHDAASLPCQNRILVFLGDYIDLGGQKNPSHAYKTVLETLASFNPAAYGLTQAVFLRGNHEDSLLDFLTGESVLRDHYSGAAASVFEKKVLTQVQNHAPIMKDYGVDVGMPIPKNRILINGQAYNVDMDFHRRMAEEFKTRFPERHLQFVRSTQLMFECGDYVFVHAGVYQASSPSRQHLHTYMYHPISSQNPFHKAWENRAIVAGHIHAPEVINETGYINIDTVHKGHLTCVRLMGKERRFLSSRDYEEDLQLGALSDCRPVFGKISLVPVQRKFD